ncbi:MAG: tRNA uridine-5-carboxymethylaminomethyl(34) synthesis GTPase MnmE [Clostridia bacterium]|nr:tRNA uridine-5-carboxymethylaminomethyl(34) synthesis GTPase MnmE [Clostridia bacterium]
MNDFNDTISSVSTAPGEGGIGIIRISGDRSLDILNAIFTKDVKTPNYMTYGHIKDQDKTVDEVMAVYFKAPHSYTREDVVEIQCHGGIVSLKKILELTLKHGARLAEPGEFTKRAFLNGRLDLTQAEAVIDLIRAKSDRTFDVSLSQLEGKFSRKIRDIRNVILDSLVNLTVNIDYPDEDIEELTYEKLKSDLSDGKKMIEDLLKTSDTGRILREGLKVSIIGKPNVGKSSLMNALLNESRAIVTEIPGTTRDTIEEAVVIRGIPVSLVDTAGIRDTEDVIEKIGIEKSKEAFNTSDLVLFIVDRSRDITDEDRSIALLVKGRKAIVLLNKTDLPEKADISELGLDDMKIIPMSVQGESGIEELKDEIEKLVYSGDVKQNDSVLITNVRHKNLLLNAAQSLSDALVLVEVREPLELIEIDVNAAYTDLGEIIGDSVNDNIIDEVFKRFCLGK